MNKYEVISVVGEGAYGVVLKCCNRVREMSGVRVWRTHEPTFFLRRRLPRKFQETNEFVAIKRFKESEEDEIVRKTTLREVKILRLLRHRNVVSLLEAFRRKGKLFLVFEYVEKNLLEVLEEHPTGLPRDVVRRYIFQLCLAIEWCHRNSVIHRDIKPENLLVNSDHTLKLCDFGFARIMPLPGEPALTDYVATRWYRAPELLLGSTDYTKAVDIWAIGCIMGELVDGQPLFPGEAEPDQLHIIQQCLGPLTTAQTEAFLHNPRFGGAGLPEIRRSQTIQQKYQSKLTRPGLHFLRALLHMDPAKRLTARECLDHVYFTGLKEEMGVTGLPPLPVPLQHDLGYSLGPQSPVASAGGGAAFVQTAATQGEDALSPTSDVAAGASAGNGIDAKLGSPAAPGVAEDSTLLSPPPAAISESSDHCGGAESDVAAVANRGALAAAQQHMAPPTKPSVKSSVQAQGAMSSGSRGATGALSGMQPLGQQAGGGAGGGSRAGGATLLAAGAGAGGTSGAGAPAGPTTRERGGAAPVGGVGARVNAAVGGGGSRAVKRATSPLQPALVPLAAEVPLVAGSTRPAALRTGALAVGARSDQKEADETKASDHAASDSKSPDAESKAADGGYALAVPAAARAVPVRTHHASSTLQPESPHGGASATVFSGRHVLAVAGSIDGDAQLGQDAGDESAAASHLQGGNGRLRDSTSRAHVLGLQQGTVHANALSSLLAQAGAEEDGKVRAAAAASVPSPAGGSSAGVLSGSSGKAGYGSGAGGSAALPPNAQRVQLQSQPSLQLQQQQRNGRASSDRSAPSNGSSSLTTVAARSSGVNASSASAAPRGGSVPTNSSAGAVAAQGGGVGLAAGGGRSSGGRAGPPGAPALTGAKPAAAPGGTVASGSDEALPGSSGGVGGGAVSGTRAAARSIVAPPAMSTLFSGVREPSPPATTPRGGPDSRGASESFVESPAAAAAAARPLRSRQGFAAATDALSHTAPGSLLAAGTAGTREPSVERSRSSLHAGGAAAGDDSTLPIPRSMTGQVYLQARLHQEATAAAAASHSAGSEGGVAGGTGGLPAGDGWDPYEHYASTRPSSSGGYARPVSQGALPAGVGGASGTGNTGVAGAAGGGGPGGGAAWWKQRGALAPASLSTGGGAGGGGAAAPPGVFGLSPRNVLASTQGSSVSGTSAGSNLGDSSGQGFGGGLRTAAAAPAVGSGVTGFDSTGVVPEQTLQHRAGASHHLAPVGSGPQLQQPQRGSSSAAAPVVQSSISRLAASGAGGSGVGSAGTAALGAPPPGRLLPGMTGLAVAGGLGPGAVGGRSAANNKR